MNNATLAPFVVRWWWVLALGAIIAAGIGFGAAATITKTYEAETQLLVGPLNTTSDLDASGTLARTYAQLAASRPVLKNAIAETRVGLTPGVGLTPEELKDATTIESNEITRILTIRVQDTDPRRAVRLADAIGERVVAMSSERRARASSGLDDFERSTEIAALAPKIQREVLTAAERVFSGSIAGRAHVTDSANVPDKPVKPSVLLIVVLAGLGGLLLAAAIGMLYDAAHEPEPPVAAAPRYAGPAPWAQMDAQYEPPQRDQWGQLVSAPGPERRAGER